MDEAHLVEKLRKIEALFAGATTDGERVAAAEARRRIQAKLADLAASDPPVEFQFRVEDEWSKKVLLAMLRRYGIEPYRYRGQRRTTVMARISRRFATETLWPEFTEVSELLRRHLEDITNRIVADVIHEDLSDVREVSDKRLPGRR
jgi:hypothetical protein